MPCFNDLLRTTSSHSTLHQMEKSFCRLRLIPFNKSGSSLVSPADHNGKVDRAYTSSSLSKTNTMSNHLWNVIVKAAYSPKSNFKNQSMSTVQG